MFTVRKSWTFLFPFGFPSFLLGYCHWNFWIALLAFLSFHVFFPCFLPSWSRMDLDGFLISRFVEVKIIVEVFLDAAASLVFFLFHWTIWLTAHPLISAHQEMVFLWTLLDGLLLFFPAVCRFTGWHFCWSYCCDWYNRKEEQSFWSACCAFSLRFGFWMVCLVFALFLLTADFVFDRIQDVPVSIFSTSFVSNGTSFVWSFSFQSGTRRSRICSSFLFCSNVFFIRIRMERAFRWF